jgi:phytoene/squalene synthetase
MIPSFFHSSLLAKCKTSQVRDDLTSAIDLVRQYDPTGYLPGMLLRENEARVAYFAVRAFWVETGLQSLTDKKLPANHKQPLHKLHSPNERLHWWRQGIAALFDADSTGSGEGRDDEEKEEYMTHPTLRLLEHALKDVAGGDNLLCQNDKNLFTKNRQLLFDEILNHREEDLHTIQYETLDDLIKHSEQSCGSLMKLALECASVSPIQNPVAYDIATNVGIAHGLTNALRTSIPVVSRTGRLIIPAELCQKYGVKTPRFLLSALSQGDTKCKEALGFAVRDIVETARSHLAKGREKHVELLALEGGDRAAAVFLPGIGAETFLDRLEGKSFDLTDLNLRNVSLMEHATCAARMIRAQQTTSY